jgi:hypothetical protein
MATKKEESQAPPELVAAYDAMVATVPEVERKGATMPFTSHNGNMFTFLHPIGLALRLPPGARDEFVAKHNTKLFDGYGMVQKEYVLVPGSVLADTAVIAPYFKTSYEYCQTLKPKKK